MAKLSGHGNFGTYHRRFNHNDYLNCIYGKKIQPEHTKHYRAIIRNLLPAPEITNKAYPHFLTEYRKKIKVAKRLLKDEEAHKIILF